MVEIMVMVVMIMTMVVVVMRMTRIMKVKMIGVGATVEKMMIVKHLLIPNYLWSHSACSVCKWDCVKEAETRTQVPERSGLVFSKICLCLCHV